MRSCELLACSLFLERHLAGFAALFLSGLGKFVLFKDICLTVSGWDMDVIFKEVSIKKQLAIDLMPGKEMGRVIINI